MMKRSVFIIALVIGSLVPVSATTLIPLKLDELCAASDQIVVGKCSSLETVVIAGHTMTRIVVLVERTVKGQMKAKEEMPLYLWGGTQDGILTIVPGAPIVSKGERLVLFTAPLNADVKRSAKSYSVGPQQVVGISQGLARVVSTSKDAEQLRVKLKQMKYAGMETSVRVGPLPEVLTDRECDELLHTVEITVTKQKENQSVKNTLAPD